MARLLWLVVLVAAWGAPAVAQDLVTPSDRVNTHVHIRVAASEDAAEIGQLNIGQGLPLVASVPRFYQVQMPGGQTGFVSKSWTTISRALVSREEDELRIHFLNIGAGSCAVVECPGSNAAPIIVDCGSLGGTATDMDAQATRTYVRNVLAQHQVPPHVVVSHADPDHYSRLPAIFDDVPVASIWQGGNPARYTEANFPAWLTMQEGNGAVAHRNFPQHFHHDGEPVSDLACGEASTFVLTANSGTSDNAQSLVLMIEYQDFTAIFTGDAEGPTETQAITNSTNAVKATVITASHHGASTFASNSQPWTDATSPAVLISSAGNRFFHPRCVAVERFTSLAATKRHDVRCGSSTAYTASRTTLAHYVTEMNGAIIITSNGRSPVTVNCTRSVECGVKIAH